jgi:hypothetical protein
MRTLIKLYFVKVFDVGVAACGAGKRLVTVIANGRSDSPSLCLSMVILDVH